MDGGRWMVDGWETLLGEEWIGRRMGSGRFEVGAITYCVREHRVRIEYYYSYAPYRRTQTSRTNDPLNNQLWIGSQSRRTTF